MFKHCVVTILCFFITSLQWSCTGSRVAQQVSAEPASYTEQIQQFRQQYLANLSSPDHGPLTKKETTGIDFFPADSTYRVPATFTRTPEAEPFDLATYSGMTKPYVKYGELAFDLHGQALTLAIYQSLNLPKAVYGNYLFLPFKDLTNDVTTYGGGRYMDFQIENIQDGTLVIDFNKAYNPYCAFKDGYNCPIPPMENHLKVAIHAGEKAYKK